MPLAGLDGALLAGAVWGLAAAALAPAFLSLAPGVSATLRLGVPRALAIAACALAAVLGAAGLAGVVPAPLEWWPGFPGQPFTLTGDALAAPFLLLFGLSGIASFALHVPHESNADAGSPWPAARPGGGAAARLSLHAGFALALLVVFLARHALLFLVAWEGMTLLSAALVASDVRSARARQATYIYLALSHLGGALVAVALLTLSARAGSFQFAELSSAYAALPPREAVTLAWLFTAGFSVKLGLLPGHIWLPAAHPEAPAPVSAMLSGVMITAGLYGMLRFAWQLPGAPPEHWGTVLVIVGALTALVGALYAAIESDAKRLLAYSTIKHAGLLALAAGLAALLSAAGRPDIAGVALAAVFYHAIGHGLAKTLAFLSVGEAVHAAGSRQLELLGGLGRRLPRTALAALVAALALCALPPLSCFAGEWLVYQALILGYSAGAGQLRLLAPFAGAGLALASALAVAAMVKLHGIGFLGRPRSAGAAQAAEPARGVTTALLVFALVPLAWGLAAPWLATAMYAPLGALLPEFDTSLLSGESGLTLRSAGLSSSSTAPAAALLMVLVVAAIARAWLRARRQGSAEVRRAPSWSCGTALDARMQYSSLGFTKPLRLIFEPVLHTERQIEVLGEGSPYAATRIRYRSHVPLVLERFLVEPLVQAVLWTSGQARRLQAGSPHLYLAYLLATLVALLLWGRG